MPLDSAHVEVGAERKEHKQQQEYREPDESGAADRESGTEPNASRPRPRSAAAPHATAPAAIVPTSNPFVKESSRRPRAIGMLQAITPIPNASASQEMALRTDTRWFGFRAKQESARPPTEIRSDDTERLMPLR